MSVLVIAEQRDGTLNRATWEAIAAAQQVGPPVRIAVLGKGLDAVAGELAAAECERVIVVEDTALVNYTADGYVLALAALIGEQQPQLVLLRTRIRPATSRRPWPPDSSGRSSPTSPGSRRTASGCSSSARCSRAS